MRTGWAVGVVVVGGRAGWGWWCWVEGGRRRVVVGLVGVGVVVVAVVGDGKVVGVLSDERRTAARAAARRRVVTGIFFGLVETVRCCCRAVLKECWFCSCK